MTSLPDRVQADLLVARKARDAETTTALRTLLAAFSNAEAPPAPISSSLDPPVVGLVEHPRLVLTDADHRRLLAEQIESREAAIVEYDGLGQVDAADALRAELTALQRYC